MIDSESYIKLVGDLLSELDGRHPDVALVTVVARVGAEIALQLERISDELKRANDRTETEAD